MACTEAQLTAAAKWRVKHPGFQTAYNRAHPGYQAKKLCESRAINKERTAAVRLAWRAAHPGAEAASTLKCNHAKLERLAGRPRSKVCEVCGASGQICFDHDHATGLFRGWICARCNHAIGHARDSIDLLIKLAEYLKAFEKKRRFKHD
jgi:hypothetical protein